MIYTNAKGIRFEVEAAMDFRDDGTMFETGAVFAGLENQNAAAGFESMIEAKAAMEEWG